MALNFPGNPQNGDTYTEDNTTWQWDGTAWNVVSRDTSRNIFTNFSADTGAVTPTLLNDTLTIVGSGSVTTSIVDKTLTINSEGGGNISNAFVTLVSDDGSFNVGSAGELRVAGGTNISTQVVTDSEQVTLDLDPFEISFLSNVSNAAPTSGQVLKWDGSQWAPAADVASGGAGLDADTLDGFDSTYYLDYTNFTNTPNVLTLGSLSVGNELAASGDGAISYDNTTGIFRYTPPDLSAYSTFDGAFSSLSGTPTTITGYGITDALQLGTTSTTALAGDTSIPSALTDLGISDGSSGQVLTTDGAGNFSFTTVSGGSSTFLSLSDTPGSFGSAGQVVVVNSTADGLEFSTAGSGGEVNQNAFSNIAVSGEGTIEADSATDTLNFVNGSNISITTNPTSDTITISAETSFADLTDATTANVSIDKIYEPATTMFRLNNLGTSAYIFEPHYTGTNPTIYIISGHTYAFDLDDIGGHPFEIQDSLGNAYGTGLVHVSPSGMVSTGPNAQGKDSGTLYWRVPETTTSPPNFRYQCQSHASMVGAITIKDLSAL